MKHILILTCILLASCSDAGWSSQDTSELEEQIATLDGQLSEQRETSDQWKAFTATLGIGCVLLFVIGTSLGAKTRHDGTRRMERTNPAAPNGSKPHVGKATAADRHQTLAT